MFVVVGFLSKVQVPSEEKRHFSLKAAVQVTVIRMKEHSQQGLS